MRAALLASLLLVAGCVVDLDPAHEGFPCNPDGSCRNGLACLGGVCLALAGTDGGQPGDAGFDGGREDAGPSDGGADAGQDAGPDAGADGGTPSDGGCARGETRSCYELGAAEVAGVGACSLGRQHCVGEGFGPCLGEVAPQREVCNGVDDDCDGVTDETDQLNAASPCGVLGICATATADCSGQCTYEFPFNPAEQTGCVANGLDDDCDGVVDDSCVCNDEGGACYGLGLTHPTLGVGPCQAGVIVCKQPSRIQDCAGQVGPATETCNGLDDDCDGATDEDDPLAGLPCQTGVPGICAEGRWACDGTGSLVCTPLRSPKPGEFLCDGLDEDCSGSADEGLEAPGTAVNCTTEQACCGGACVSLTNDGAHCGGCNVPCSADANPCTEDACVGAECVHPVLTDGTPCGAGTYCQAGACVPACVVDARLYQPDERDPPGSCMGCYPQVNAVALTVSPDGAACGVNQVCSGGSCGDGCVIGGAWFSAGAPHPTQPCMVCDPVASLTTWSPAVGGVQCNDGNACTEYDVCDGAGACGGTPFIVGTLCDAARICDGAGVCTAACFVDGALRMDGTLNPANPCQVCTSSLSTSAWSSSAPGSACGSGQVCDGTGGCVSGCWIGGVLYADQVSNPANACQRCAASLSVSAWSAQVDGTACTGGVLNQCQGGVCQ